MRFRFTAVATAVLLLGFPAPPALAATPEAPALVAPASGSTAGSLAIPLTVTASDPDGDGLDVRFEGRVAGATVPGDATGDPFTVVVLPDTQNYTYGGRQGIMSGQTQWVVNTRSSLNTAMVIHLGDLVSEYDNLTQWGYSSAAMKILDDANVPNTVLPGNHDFATDTGEFTQYDAAFPPSRYADATWSPSTARWGGYLGQNQFGTDAIDRRNMDNFALFRAGGRDFLVLNLEWEAPAYTLDWAAKVLAAYPERIAILATHSFVGIDGQRSTLAQRPGGTPPNQLWSEFVSQQCSIRLVVSGHYHDGDVGEANRSDLNRCGRPVQQVLTDYQDRANGGDGWLRYYTFDPAAGTLHATTYSTSLDRYETDADSSFTVPFDLSEPQPAPFTTIATVPVASGGTASTTWSGLEPDTTYEWRAVAGDGTSSATSPTWTVRTPKSSDLVDDTFTRTVNNGWGAADAQHAWQAKSSPIAYSVDGSAGRITATPGQTRGVSLTGLDQTGIAITTDLSLAQAATGSGTYVSLLGRLAGTNSYRAKLRYLAGGTLSLSLVRYLGSETTLASKTVSGITVSPGTGLRVRFELDGTAPTTLRAKVWRVGTAEPAAWGVTATDATAVLQSSGTVGLDVYTSSTAGAASTVSVDRFMASPVGPVTPPANQAPTAVIDTPTVTDLTVHFSGTGSTDPDGAVTGYAWDYGDNSTGAGPAPTHSYAAAGTYTVTLTVTDDDGATATATRPVTLTAPQPNPGPLAEDTFTRSVGNGWGAADTGGPWTLTGSTSRYQVSAGLGQHVLTAGGSSATSTLAGVDSTSTDVRATLVWSRGASAGTLYAAVLARRVGTSGDYRCKVVVSTAGAVTLQAVRTVGNTETSLGSARVSGLTQASGTAYRVACRAVPGGGGTMLSAKFWRVGSAEPGSWQVTATDTTASLQVAGGIGFWTYLSSTSTAPVTTSIDDLLATDPDA